MLIALRQIIRAIDMHSKRLIKEAGLTSPQLLLLKGIDELGQISMRQLADHTNMSQATATTIMDRLEPPAGAAHSQRNRQTQGACDAH